MDDTKITKDRIRNHFTYAWWRYALLLGAAIFGWNLIYTSTAYRPPKDKKMSVYFVIPGIADGTLEALEAQMLSMFPDIEDANCLSVLYTEGDTYYGDMQLTTFMGAGEGDVYLLPRERFEAFAGGGTFVRLDEAIESGAIALSGLDVSAGRGHDEETNADGIYGIPAGELFGFMEKMGIDNRDLVICVMAYSPEVNQARAMQWISWLIAEMRAPKPDWVIEQENASGMPNGAPGISEMPSY